MKTILLYICMILLPSVCFAEDIYISQAAQGADSGSSCSNSHGLSWFNTSGNWSNPKVSGKIGPGDTTHLCGTITTQLTTQASGNSGSPITILFESGAKYSTGTWTTNTGAIDILNNYITLDGGVNGIVEATDNGTTAAFGGTKTYNRDIYGVLVNGASNVTVKSLTIRTIYDRLAGSTDCFQLGRAIQVIGNSNNVFINGNILSDASYVISFVLSNTSNITVANNTVCNGGVGINIAPGNSSSTGTNVNVYGNDVRGGNKWDGIFDSNCQANGCSSSCLTDTHVHQDGMHLFSQGDTGWVNGVNIYDNNLQDFGTHSTAHIYIEYHGMQNVKIYNNVLLNTGTNYASNGMIAIKAADNVKIYNNSLVGAGSSITNTGIYWNSNGTTTSQGGDIKNNIMSGVKTYIARVAGTTFSADNNNMYNGQSTPFYDSGSGFHDWTWWQGQGYDTHGMTANPQLSSTLQLTSSSPGTEISGGINFSNVFTTDKTGMARPSTGGWSLGAYQYNLTGLVRPSAPLSLRCL